MRPLRRPALSFPSYFLSLLFFHYYKGIFSLKGYFHWKFFKILMRKFHFEIIFPGDITIFFSAALFFAQQKEI